MKKLLCFIAGSLLAQSANAAIITVSGSFTATNWVVFYGSPITQPIDPLTLSYSATFDDSLTYQNDSSVLSLSSSNIPYAIKFNYAPSDSPGNPFILATIGFPAGCVISPATFCAFVQKASGMAYDVSQSSPTGGGWRAGTITPGIAAVPEPASWAMMIAGFGLVGTMMRRRGLALT